MPRSDRYLRFLRKQIVTTQVEMERAQVQDIAAASDGSGSRARHTVLRKRGALQAYRVCLRAYRILRVRRGQ